MSPNTAGQSRQQFETDGFVRIGAFADETLLTQLEANIDRYLREIAPQAPESDVFYENRDQPLSLKQLIRMHEHDRYFASLLTGGRLQETAATLLGEPAVPRNMQLFIKPPPQPGAGVAGGQPTPPHQDGFYFMIEPCAAITLWLALDDVDEDNGCLLFVRSSHAGGLRPHARTETLGFSQGVSDFGTAADVANEVAVTAARGDLLAHHALTIHRADGNRAPERPRRALGLIYYGASAREDLGRQEAYQRQLQSELRQTGRI